MATTLPNLDVTPYHGNIFHMTLLLESAVARITELPEDRQDEVAQILFDIAASDTTHYRLTDAQFADVQLAREEVRQGKFASDDEMAAFWNGIGR